MFLFRSFSYELATARASNGSRETRDCLHGALPITLRIGNFAGAKGLTRGFRGLSAPRRAGVRRAGEPGTYEKGLFCDSVALIERVAELVERGANPVRAVDDINARLAHTACIYATKADVRAPKLSGGMRRRLLLARALMHRPRLVILDEPTAGVDFELRHELWRYIRQLHSEGTTILMSTHYIEEAQRLADTVLIMSHGKAVAGGAPAELVEHYAGSEAVEVYGPPDRLAEVEAEAAAAGLRTRRTGTSISVLGASNGRFEGERRPANLEDVFVLLTGEEIE